MVHANERHVGCKVTRQMIRFLPYLFALVLTWDYPPGYTNVQFNVYSQTISLPTPYWSAGGNPVCAVVTTSWLTNGWNLVATVSEKRYAIPNVRDDNILHAFIVTAKNKSLGESDPATK